MALIPKPRPLPKLAKGLAGATAGPPGLSAMGRRETSSVAMLASLRQPP